MGMVKVAGICVLIVCVMGWLTQLPSRSQEGKGVFFIQLPRGSLEAKMPECCGTPLSRCLYHDASRADLETSCSWERTSWTGAHKHPQGCRVGPPALPAFCAQQLLCCRDSLQGHVVDQASRLEKSCVFRG